MKGHFQRLQSVVAINLGMILFFLFLSPLPAFSEGLPEIVTSLTFDMEKKTMKGISKITLHREGDTLIRSGSLKILSLKLNGNPVEPIAMEGYLKTNAGRGSVLEIEYECLGKQNSSCIIDERGILLIGTWYPSPEGLVYHKLSALVPKDFTAISEAEKIEREEKREGNLFSFTFPHPLDGTNLIAAEFTIKKERFNDIELYGYFFPEDSGLADTYLEHTKKYLELYNGIVGAFPFTRFSVVENFLPTGYSMPTFTLLGQDVIRLPFIVRTSLGHEILHQWLGNLVYIDYEKGNWAEGLTTYLSDHLYEEREGRGWQYRKQILIDYESYVSEDKEFALRDFRSRVDFASKAIGYGKAAMVFHMLKELTGGELFSKSLRTFLEKERFQRASWDDIRTAFETTTGRQLGWFFRQWVDEKGFPLIEIKDVSVSPKDLQSVVSFDVAQNGYVYTINIPISVKTAKEETKETLKMSEKRQSFEITANGNPENLIIDENYDIFRKLTRKEIPPIVAELLGEDKGLLILPSGEKEDSPYPDAIDFFRQRGFVPEKPEEVRDEDIRKSSGVILGYENPLVKRFLGSMEKPSPGFVLVVKKNPLDPSKVIAIVNGYSREEVRTALPKILHYGKYSVLAFEGGKNIEKKIDGSERGWIMPLREPVLGIEVAKAITLPDIADAVAGKRIIYAGEQHDKYEDHLAQLEMIRELYKKNPHIAIGMEMFERSSQKALDDYIEGRIDEREFLKSSGYFKQWGFDYNLYKDILRFAREERIPVVALNIRKEIVSKISKKGMDSLTEEEKKELPESMDMTDEAYRERLKEIFKNHESAKWANFDNFYQSQVVWDEIMAQSVAEYLKKNPDRQMIVIAGAGHLFLGSGIPKRAYRRNGADYAVIVQDASAEKNIADFILFPQPVKAPASPKIGVFLEKERGQVKIAGFASTSVAEKAGMRENDILLSLDSTPVEDLEDVQIFFFHKKKGDVVKIKALRKRFLFGEKELEFDVTL